MILPTTARAAASLGLLLVCSFRSPQETPAKDAEVQGLIRTAMTAESQAQMDERLKALAGLGGQRLVPQLLYYSVDAGSTRDAMAFGIIVDRLRIDQDVLVGPLVPFLGAEDAALREQAANILAGCEGGGYDRPPDFEIYRTLLQDDVRAGKIPNVHLTQHLFEAHPGTALLLFRSMSLLDPKEDRAILWAEHVVADAVWKYEHGFLKPDQVDAAAAEQLAQLSQSPVWWARLYVARIMQQQPPLRDASIERALKQDENELVRQVFAQE